MRVSHFLSWSRWRSLAVVCLLATSILAVSPGVPAHAQSSGVQSFGAVAIDNNNNGWAWGLPANPNDDGHLVRIEDGVYNPVDPKDPATAEVQRVTVVLEKIVLSGKGNEGWATGTGGGPRIWHIQNGTWKAYSHNIAKGWILRDITINADATDGWLTAEGDKLTFRLFRLRNGQWVEQKGPFEAGFELVSMSPDGRQAWAIGPVSTGGESGNIIYQWVNGAWVQRITYGNKLAEYPESYALSSLTVDNRGNGWVLGSGNELDTSDRVLTRLSIDGPHPVKVNITPLPGSKVGRFGLHKVQVDGLGRGYAAGIAEMLMRDGTSQIVPLLFWLDGDTAQQMPYDFIHFKTKATLDDLFYMGTIAMSKDGSHAWLMASNYDTHFWTFFQLTEPWAHESPVEAQPFVGPGICFDVEPYCLRGPFAAYWQAHGGLQQFGYPVTPEVQEVHGKTVYTVQYTERARLEYHPENKPPYDVLLGRLGADVTADRVGEEPFQPVPPCGSCNLLFFPETGHAIGAELQSYWQHNGGLPVFGYPKSEAFQEKSPTDGNTYLVQYFERNRLEYHPENKGTPYEVQLGRLGAEQFETIYGYAP